MEVKSRHHLRSDQITAIRDAVADHLGVDIDGDTFEFVEFVDAGYELVLVDGDPAVFYVDDDEPFLTTRRRASSRSTPARSRSSPTAPT